MWCFGTPVILILVCYISLCDAQVTLQLCDAPIKDEICVLECRTPDLSQSVVFKKDNTEYASCKYILGTLSCTSIYATRSLISQQINVTSLNITQLSRAGDQGSWTCDYGSTGSTAQTLTVLTAPEQRGLSPDVDIDFCTGNQSDAQDVKLTVTCSSEVKVSAELYSTSGSYPKVLPVTKGPACSDVAENKYTAVFTITNTTGGLTGSGYTLTFTTKLTALPASVSESYMYETQYTSDISLACVPPVPVHVPCTCTLTIVLRWVLSVVFTAICMISTGFILIKCMNIDIVENIKKEMVCYIIIIIVCVVVSCGLGGGVTTIIMNGHDKGIEPDCSCMVYIGILLPLVFAAVVAGVFIFVCWCLNSRKEKESGKREDPEGKEEKPKVADAPVVSDKPPKEEKDNGKKQDYTDKLDGKKKHGELPPIEILNKSPLDTMPPRPLPLAPINHQKRM